MRGKLEIEINYMGISFMKSFTEDVDESELSVKIEELHIELMRVLDLLQQNKPLPENAHPLNKKEYESI